MSAATLSQPEAAITTTTPAATPKPDGLSKTDIWSIVITLLGGIALIILASQSARRGWVLGLAVAVGALGGLAHEIAQSGGKILFFERKLDGIYLGSLAGAILGGVAGLLAIRGLIIDPASIPSNTELIYQAFIAGMALKGVTEAAGGQAIPSGSDSVTPGQAMAAEATMNAIAGGGAMPGVPALPASLGPLPDALSKPLGPLPDELPADL